MLDVPHMADGRHEALLWGEPISYPIPVLGIIATERPDGIEASLDENLAHADDAYWSKFIRRPFTWQLFTEWWIARRWIRPRDITKE